MNQAVIQVPSHLVFPVPDAGSFILTYIVIGVAMLGFSKCFYRFREWNYSSDAPWYGEILVMIVFIALYPVISAYVFYRLEKELDERHLLKEVY